MFGVKEGKVQMHLSLVEDWTWLPLAIMDGLGKSVWLELTVMSFKCTLIVLMGPSRRWWYGSGMILKIMIETKDLWSIFVEVESHIQMIILSKPITIIMKYSEVSW